jgi:hypothetical protein
MAEQVPEAFDLGFLFVGDDGHLIAPLEDGPSPAGQAIDLPGQLGLEIPHEAGELLGVVGGQEQVVVAGHRGHSMNPHAMASLSPAEDAEEDVVETGSGAQEVASLEGAVGDGEEGPVLGYVAKFSCHVLE